MCKYCERRTDVKLGWDQPELPWHDNYDITKNISGNMIHTDDTVGVIHDYQTASPVLIIKDKSCFGSEEDGVGTIYIPIKFCPECGRKLDDSRYCGKLVKEREKYEEKMCGYFQGTIANGYGNDFSKRSGKNVRPNGSDHITISEGGTHPKTDRCNYIG